MKQERFETGRLLATLEKFAGQRLFVAVLGSPDPDGLASAWALKYLGAKVGARLDILMFEAVSRPENAALIRLLNLPCRQVTGRLPRVPYAGYALVDRQNPTLPVPHPPTLPLVVFVDHHMGGPVPAAFCEQYSDVGSTSTIMAHHLVAATENDSDDAREEISRVATALMYGIRTDTSDFLNASALDFEAAMLLAPFVATDVMREIALTPLGAPFLKTLGVVLTNAKSSDGLVVAWAGRVGRKARDTISQSADFLIKGEGVKVCVVFGLMDGQVVGSVRATVASFDPNGFLRGALCGGLGLPANCGGRPFAGGFLVKASALGERSQDEIREILSRALFSVWSEYRVETTVKAGRKRRGSPGQS